MSQGGELELSPPSRDLAKRLLSPARLPIFYKTSAGTAETRNPIFTLEELKNVLKFRERGCSIRILIDLKRCAEWIEREFGDSQLAERMRELTEIGDVSKIVELIEVRLGQCEEVLKE